MLTRLGLGFLWLLHWLPQRWLSTVGQGFGLLFMVLGLERRKVVQTNLRVCFPSMDERERSRVARAHFRAAGRAFADTTVAWWGSPERLRRLVRIEGEEHARAAIAAGPTIALAPHFVGVEVMAMRLSMDYDAVSLYSRQKNPLFDQFLVSRRVRFRPLRMLSRQDGIKPVIRAIRDGIPFLLMPDMDLGPRDTIFVPFFGVQAATVASLPRLVAITGAKVLPVVVRQEKDGYVVRIYPPWNDFPSGDVLADTRRMNAFIEERAREQLTQYYWLHKRFKTRPEGEKRFY